MKAKLSVLNGRMYYYKSEDQEALMSDKEAPTRDSLVCRAYNPSGSTSPTRIWEVVIASK